ncbi:HutD family protein [Leucobacter japonicus]|uniref:HutD family protein n=1 Tax=Leucobacter japonicus TaxID=1461259 RepID=UPI0006A76D24|nr:HutD family protein [Leucobacter japonicus]
MSVDARVSPESWLLEQPFERLTAAPWANGLGATTEIVGMNGSRAVRPELDAPAWRLSIAELREPAAFSPLPEVHRNFMPVGGDVVLEVGGVRHEVPSGTVLRFSGDADVTLVALSEPCHAVNLMSRSDAVCLWASKGAQPAPITESAHVAAYPAARLDATEVADPATRPTRLLAAVALPDAQTDPGARANTEPGTDSETHASTSAAPRFDLYVPSLGTTGAPPFPAAVVELA